MFNANFSFLPSTTPTARAPQSSQFSGTSISPTTSRSPSPHQSFAHERSAASSSRRLSRDTRYDAYRTRQSSVTAITAQLQSHVISTDHTASPTLSSPGLATPSDVSLEADDSVFDGPNTPASTATDYSSADDFDTTQWDLAMTDLEPTSSPRPSLSLEAQALSSFTQRRRQRQALVRLQCLARRAPDLAMLLEECHPSSMPLDQGSSWAGSRRNSSGTNLTSFSSGRVG